MSEINSEPSQPLSGRTELFGERMDHDADSRFRDVAQVRSTLQDLDRKDRHIVGYDLQAEAGTPELYLHLQKVAGYPPKVIAIACKAVDLHDMVARPDSICCRACIVVDDGRANFRSNNQCRRILLTLHSKAPWILKRLPTKLCAEDIQRDFAVGQLLGSVQDRGLEGLRRVQSKHHVTPSISPEVVQDVPSADELTYVMRNFVGCLPEASLDGGGTYLLHCFGDREAASSGSSLQSRRRTACHSGIRCPPLNERVVICFGAHVLRRHELLFGRNLLTARGVLSTLAGRRHILQRR
mmetsp:Transcript_99379/g.207018  ORF Transcript_99379/g.207018 Transcript_99379/m.207018 type:complete len:296 (+) Transcript_99379:1091-1978(+)